MIFGELTSDELAAIGGRLLERTAGAIASMEFEEA